MPEKFVVCRVNENYLKNVKKQMKEQKMPLPKDDGNITIAHNPVATFSSEDLCDCNVCKKISATLL